MARRVGAEALGMFADTDVGFAKEADDIHRVPSEALVALILFPTIREEQAIRVVEAWEAVSVVVGVAGDEKHA